MRAAFLAFLTGLCVYAQPTRFDLVITGAKLVDGSGNPAFYADIGIRGDTITAIGLLGDAPAAVRIDARGLIAAPGFIDIHSHGRRGIFNVPTAENYLREGVTTIIEGPDGGSPLPVAPFLERIATTGVSINFATFVGQGTIRSTVMGLVDRKATPQELDKMKALAVQAMKDGAFGMSTGLFYVPGNFTPTEEVIELAKVVGRMGGIHISHMREEAGKILDSVRETIRIGEEGGLPTQITHHKIIGRPNWGKSVETLKLVEEARARGVDVTIDQYPYTASSTGIAALFPQWSLEGGSRSTAERLAAPDQRTRIKATIVQNLQLDRGAGDPKNVQIVNCSFDPTLAGKNLSDITRARGAEPTFENAAETAIDLILKGGCSAIYHAIQEEDVVRIMQSPYTMIASDGDIPVFGTASPHPRSYGTFARVLGVYVREKRVLTLEDAVRRMSAYPAQRLKIWDRGMLRPGMKADIVIFDPAKVADRSQFDKPHQYSVGFRDVIVNGKSVLRNDAVTAESARPRAVRSGPSVNLLHLFDHSLLGRRDIVGLEFEGREYTFGEIESRSNRLAHLFLDHGFKPGDRLCVYLANCIEMIDIFLACVKLGIIFVPINILYRDREIAHIVSDAEPAAVLRTTELTEEAQDFPDTRPNATLDGDTPAGIIYTSGTTGTSKGAVLTHNNFAANAVNLLTCWQITATDRLLLALPLFHVHGLGNGLHCWLMSGCRMRLLERFERQTAAATFLDFRPTLFFGVPTIYTRLLAVPEAQAREIGRSMRLFVSGSAPLPAQVFEEFRARFGHAILERYGMSETLMNISNPYLGERRPGTIGLPLPGISVRLVDGEVHLKGPNVFPGYWRREEATRAAFDDGWFRTGDLATCSPDGYYTLCGRKSDLIISGGFNIYPREIEEFLEEQPEVSEAAVVGAPDPARGELPVAYIVLKSPVDPATLEHRCCEKLASFKVPRNFHFVENLPRNALGKIQKHLLHR